MSEDRRTARPSVASRAPASGRGEGYDDKHQMTLSD
jgi:hypothetical protein